MSNDGGLRRCRHRGCMARASLEDVVAFTQSFPVHDEAACGEALTLAKVWARKFTAFSLIGASKVQETLTAEVDADEDLALAAPMGVALLYAGSLVTRAALADAADELCDLPLAPAAAQYVALAGARRRVAVSGRWEPEVLARTLVCGDGRAALDRAQRRHFDAGSTQRARRVPMSVVFAKLLCETADVAREVASLSGRTEVSLTQRFDAGVLLCRQLNPPTDT